MGADHPFTVALWCVALVVSSFLLTLERIGYP